MPASDTLGGDAKSRSSGGTKMKYNNLQEDMVAIKQLLETGYIDVEEARELRRYVEALA